MTAASAVQAISSDLTPRTKTARNLTAAAAVWFAIGLVHVGVFLVDGGAWAGAVSWRKPITFSLSIATLLWAFGWIIDRVRNRPRLAATLAWTLIVSSSIEVGLIAFQQWRGRPSHFNIAAGQDALIFTAMGAMVGVMSLALIGLLIWTLVDRPRDRVERLAIWSGLALIMAALGLGQWLINTGLAFVDKFGVVPETLIYGEAGIAKFPHAIPFHGIQVFALVLAGFSVTSLAVANRLLILRVTVLSYAGLVVYAVLATFGGRDPLDPTVVSGSVAVASVGGIAWAAAKIVSAVRRDLVHQEASDLATLSV